MAFWHHMVILNWVNIGSGNDLLPDSTKPLPEPMLTLWHSPEGDFTGNVQDINLWYKFMPYQLTMLGLYGEYCLIQTKIKKRYFYPSHNEVVGEVYWFHSVRPSVCPSVHASSRVRFVTPTVLVGYISYLFILSSNFRRCVAFKVFL